MQHRNLLLAVLAVAALSGFSVSALAAPIVLTDTCGPAVPAGDGPGPGGTCVTGILNLDIGGVLFNVDIEVASGADLFGDATNPSPVPYFWGDRAGASAAVSAIVAALNDVGGIVGATGSAGSRYWIDVPWGSAGSDLAVEFADGPFYGDPWFNAGSGQCGFSPPDCSEEGWALFTVVPEPGTVLLLGGGLMGIAVHGRKRRV